MARAYGSRAQMNVAFETVYGTPPASGYRTMPFASSGLGAMQPLLENELLGFGRDPLAPIKDAVTADGRIAVPIDVENLGFWLKAAFGAPTTTGTTPKVHTFQSGGLVLPSMAIELGYPEVPQYAMNAGCMVDRLRWNMERSGQLRMDVDIVAQGENAPSATTGAGTPTSYALTRFGNFNGSISRDGSALGNIESAEFIYSNNLDRVETIRSDGKIDGADPTIASLTGRIVARFADTTLLTQAINGTPCELISLYSLGANAQFQFTAHAVYLPRPKVSVEGPKGIRVEFEWQAAKAASPARMCTAVLTNTVATY
jgi:hypothetical protein